MTFPPRRLTLQLAFVAACSLLPHLKGLTAPLLDYHHHRQINTALIARNYWRDSLPFHKPRVDWQGPDERHGATELPVYMWLYGKLWPVGGLGELWGRLLSVVASLATALLLFFFFRRELGAETAFYGACLFGLVPLEIYFGRTVQPEATALLALVASLYLWDDSLKPGRPWGAWLGATLCAAIAVGSKLPYAHLFIPLAALTWRRLGRKALLDARTWAAGLAAAGIVVAWYLWARAGSYVVPTRSGDYVGLLAYDRLPYFIQFQLLSRFPELVVTYGGLPLFFYGAYAVVYKKRDPFWIAWVGGVFLHLFAMGGYSHYHEYTALPLVPAAAGLMGEGLRLLREKAARRAWALAGLALLVAAVPIHAALRIPHWYKQGFVFARGAADAARAVSAPGDLFYTNCAAPSLLLYHLNRRGWSDELDQHPDLAEERLAEAAKRGAKFLATPKSGLFAEPDGRLWRKFTARGKKPLWDDGQLAVFPL